MLKSYRVTLSPDNKLCNSVMGLTQPISKVISVCSGLNHWIAKTLICCCFTVD
ncbi:MAG: hypothetical protein ACRC85_00615 [Kluyvera ascorbata]